MHKLSDPTISEYGLEYDGELYEHVLFDSITEEGMNYYKWTEDCNKLYSSNINTEWEKIFCLLPAIQYKTTYEDIGSYIVDSSKFLTFEDKEFEKNFNHIHEVSVEEPTGYIVPYYNFLEYKLDNEVFSDDEIADYNKAVKLFDLKKNKKINPYQYSAIGDFRNVLQDQIERQASAIQDIHQEIAGIFKIIYFETHRVIHKKKSNEASKSEILKLDRDWRCIKKSLSELYISKIQKGRSLKDINDAYEMSLKSFKSDGEKDGYPVESSCIFQIENNKYLPKELFRHTVSGYKGLMKGKEEIIKTALSLAKRIRPLESILEDFFMGRKIKSLKEYNKYSKQKNTHKGRHKKNKKWILNTFNEQLKLLEVEDQAVKETEVLYEMKFDKPINVSTIRRYIKEDREDRKNS